MPKRTTHHPHQGQLALVVFHVGPYRAALEARHVLTMTDAPSLPRTANAHTLLHASDKTERLAPPTRWLTLRVPSQADLQHLNVLPPGVNRSDANRLWQLGVNDDITLQQLPTEVLYPLPALLRPRCFTDALRGVTFIQQQVVLLLDATRLTPPAIDS